MNNQLQPSNSTRIGSGLFALLLTVVTLAGVDLLAQSEGSVAQLAQTPTPSSAGASAGAANGAARS